MHPTRDAMIRSRRDFLTSSASGIGGLALASLFREDGLLAATLADGDRPGDPPGKAPHFPARAKACICIYLEGAPSQIDLFDPKPKLNDLNGQPLPESFTKGGSGSPLSRRKPRASWGPTASSPRAVSVGWRFPTSCRTYSNASMTSR